MANVHQSFSAKVYAHPVAPVEENWINNKNHILVDSPEALEQALSPIGDMIGYDTETSGLDWSQDVIAGFSFTIDGQTGYYVPVNHVGSVNLDPEVAFSILKKHIKGKKVVTYNKRFDAGMTKNYGIDLWTECHLIDTMVLAYIFDTNMHSPPLKEMAMYVLGQKMITFEEMLGVKPGSISVTNIDPRQCYVYASCDALVTFNLYVKLHGIISSWGSVGLIELDELLVEALNSLERTPIPVDTLAVSKLSEEIRLCIDKAKEDLYSFAGKVFPINSTRQLSTVLVSSGVPLSERTKTGQLKTGADVLKVFERDFPIVDALRRYREYTKLLNFADMLSHPYKLSEQTDWWNTNIRDVPGKDDIEYVIVGYNPYNVPSGRLSCRGKDKKKSQTIFSGVNIQQIPKIRYKVPYRLVLREVDDSNSIDLVKFSPENDFYLCYEDCGKVETGKCRHTTECKGVLASGKMTPRGLNFRNVFKPYPGHIFLHADFASQEVFIPAWGSMEPIWVKAILNDLDVHRSTAAALFQVPYDEVTPEQRDAAKSLTFGLLYGQGPRGISITHGIPLDLAYSLYDKFKKSLVTLMNWLEGQTRRMYSTGYVETIYGRRRYMTPWLNSANRADKGYAERTSYNHPIQGSAADMMRIALTRFYLYKDKPPWNFGNDLILLSTVHDEVNGSVHPSVYEKAVAFFQFCLVFPLPGIPQHLLLKADYSIGPDWGSQVELTTEQLVPMFVNHDIQHFLKTEKVNQILSAM